MLDDRGAAKFQEQGQTQKEGEKKGWREIKERARQASGRAEIRAQPMGGQG